MTWPISASWDLTSTSIAALVILVLTYVGVAIGPIPGLRLDRAGIALLIRTNVIVLPTKEIFYVFLCGILQ